MNRQSKKVVSELNTLKQVGVKLLCGPSRVYALINSGQLVAIKMGRNTFVTDKSIDDFIDNLPEYPVEPAIKKRQQKAAA